MFNFVEWPPQVAAALAGAGAGTNWFSWSWEDPAREGEAGVTAESLWLFKHLLHSVSLLLFPLGLAWNSEMSSPS